jgi:hypothetical protein
MKGKSKSKRTKGIEQAHPFDGLSKVNPHAAGVDIGAEEVVVCVAPNETTQLVRGFGNYTVDLHAIAAWLSEHKIKSVATPAPTAGAVWKARGCTGSRCLSYWKSAGLSVC